MGRLSLKDTIGQLKNDLEACGKEREKQLVLINSLKSGIDSCKDKYSTLRSDFDTYRLKFRSDVSALIPFDAELAASFFRARIMEKELKNWQDSMTGGKE